MDFQIGGSTKLAIDNAGKIKIGNNIPMWSGSYGGALFLKGNNATSDRYAQLCIVDSNGAIGQMGLVINNNGSATFGGSGNVTITDGDLQVASGHGIDFSATGNSAGTMSSEILDDYEEGTWTPDLRNHTTSFSTQTWDYGPQATYTKIGRMVFIHLSGRLSSVAGNGTGEFRIFGLPFTPHGTGGYQEYRMNFFLGNQPNIADSYSAFAFVRNGGSDLGTRRLAGGDNVFTANRIDSNTFFSIFGCYNTA